MASRWRWWRSAGSTFTSWAGSCWMTPVDWWELQRSIPRTSCPRLAWLTKEEFGPCVLGHFRSPIESTLWLPGRTSSGMLSRGVQSGKVGEGWLAWNERSPRIESVGIAVAKLGSFGDAHSPVSSTAMNAFCGMFTEPMDFIFCFPFFWASSSLRLRLTSPP